MTIARCADRASRAHSILKQIEIQYKHVINREQHHREPEQLFACTFDECT